MKQHQNRKDKISLLKGLLSGVRSIDELHFPEILVVEEFKQGEMPIDCSIKSLPDYKPIPPPPLNAIYWDKKNFRYYSKEDLDNLRKKKKISLIVIRRTESNNQKK